MPIFLLVAGLAQLLVAALVIVFAPSIMQQIFAAILGCSAFVLFALAEISRLAARATASLERIEKRMVVLDEHSAERLAPIRTAAERLNSLGR